MGSIRNIAVGLPVKDGHVLLSESFDQRRGLRFHRAVGGGIEFGETAVQALRREFREELDVALDEVRQLGVLENLFEYEGQPGHEYVHVFAVRSADLDEEPLDAELVVLDEGSPVRWVPAETDAPVFPDGVLDLLAGTVPMESSAS
ncbi:ADP-ribose pyrophosphatase YjhB (NUDIX family) [Curtobacterium sp. PhB172]|uniref:NUDIX hydrolase n=1 Tax=Curtobacterium sp. PhB172 TaxID=2485196 RepID=UPI000F4BA61A|nr:NUDIX domain-containing protein [Curtobacterium sp. PhB172]ROS58404.1 ADP-ribose pyrophosphatase YjhB (NUDIX family) [Curtobacterium sp. PhB172]